MYTLCTQTHLFCLEMVRNALADGLRPGPRNLGLEAYNAFQIAVLDSENG